jgi:hypothetical protein
MKNATYTTKDKIKDFFGILLTFIIFWLIMMFINSIEPVIDDIYYNNTPEDTYQKSQNIEQYGTNQ